MRELQHFRAVHPAGEIIKRIAGKVFTYGTITSNSSKFFQHKQATLEFLGLGRSSVSVRTRLSLHIKIVQIILKETKNDHRLLQGYYLINRKKSVFMINH